MSTSATHFPAAGPGGVAAGPGGTTTLQQAYDNSTTPNITVVLVKGAVEYQSSGTINDAATVLEVLNGADGTTFSVSGDGNVTAASYVGLPNRTLFISNVDVTIAALMGPTTLVGAGAGSVTIPAGTLNLDTKIEIKLQGIHTSVSNQAIQFFVFLGGTTIAKTIDTPFEKFSATTDSHWDLSVEFVVRSVGTMGTVMATGKYTNALNNHFGLINTALITNINTDIDQDVDVKITYDSVSANSITTQIMEIEVLNV